MFDADFRAKPMGVLGVPPLIESGITLDGGASLTIGSPPGGGVNGLKIPTFELFATFPDLCSFAVAELWEQHHDGLRIDAIGDGGVVITSIPTIDSPNWLHYPLVAPDGKPSIRRLRFWHGNGEPFLARLRAQ